MQILSTTKQHRGWLAFGLIILVVACGPVNSTEPVANNPPITANTAPDSPPNTSEVINDAEGDNANPFLIDEPVGSGDASGIEVGFLESGHAYRGNLNAPVVIKEFSDYQCPFCSRFVNETLPFIEAEQIANGEVLLVYYDFPLTSIHPQAFAAANAARCAGEQGAEAYWAMHDLLFENPGEWGHANANAVFIEYGQALGLEMVSYEECVTTNKYAEAINADIDFGLSQGVRSTPSFFINDQPFIGAQPLPTFNDAIAAVKAGEQISATGPEPTFVAPTPAAIPIGETAVVWALGNPNAAVQIVEYTDYQCPYCQQHAVYTMPSLLSEMIDTGRVYYVFKDFPLDNIHPEARAAAVAVRCGAAQGAFLEMHDIVFFSQTAWSGQGTVIANEYFVNLATDLGLDPDTFNACLEDGRVLAQVQANVDEALQLGVGSTPTFFINGYMVTGAQPYDSFVGAIELAEAGGIAAAIEENMRLAYLSQQQQQQPPQPTGPVDVPVADAYAIGDPNAPVTIVEYTDYQCPFCSRHFAQTYPLIRANYIDNGLVRYVFKDFPLTSIHPQAVTAAEAARCAGDQDAYIAMHDILFANQDRWAGRNDAADLFVQYAHDIGLDTEIFSKCLTSHEHEAAVIADLNEGIDFGVQGTPAFFINGHFLSGAQPYSTFDEAIQFFLNNEES